jgi:hypothetical protein
MILCFCSEKVEAKMADFDTESEDSCSHSGPNLVETREAIVCKKCGFVMQELDLEEEYMKQPMAARDLHRQGLYEYADEVLDDVEATADEKAMAKWTSYADHQYIKRHKKKPRSAGRGELYIRDRANSERFKKDYIAMIPDQYLLLASNFDYFKVMITEGTPEKVEALRLKCVHGGKVNIENLLRKYHSSHSKKPPRQAVDAMHAWRLDYKLDYKIYAACLACILQVPPSSQTGYKGMKVKKYASTTCEEGDPVSAIGAVDFDYQMLCDFQKAKIITSNVAPHSLVRLEIEMWKSYLGI